VLAPELGAGIARGKAKSMECA